MLRSADTAVSTEGYPVISTTGGVVRRTPHDGFISRYREAFVAELRGFLTAVQNDTPVVADAGDAHAAVRAAVAARESFKQNRPIRLTEAAPAAGEGTTA